MLRQGFNNTKGEERETDTTNTTQVVERLLVLKVFPYLTKLRFASQGNISKNYATCRPERESNPRPSALATDALPLSDPIARALEMEHLSFERLLRSIAAGSSRHPPAHNIP